jgi:hypothetical protein
MSIARADRSRDRKDADSPVRHRITRPKITHAAKAKTPGGFPPGIFVSDNQRR